MNINFGHFRTGTWRATLQTPGGELPFQMEVYQEGEKCVVEIINGDEHLATTEVELVDMTVFITPAVFHSEIKATISADGQILSGYWHDYSRNSNYQLPFFAQLDLYHRFSEKPSEPLIELEGRWKTLFMAENGDSSLAVGVFEQDGNHLSGTFLTPTGDYRYLDGEVDGANFSLSAFDGSHAFLFTGQCDGDTLSGTFYSGNHWKETFTAARDDNFELPDPSKMTQLVDSAALNFCFPDEFGNSVCLADERFRNKPVIIQLMATWCPNCMDESALLAELFKNYHFEGLEIIALAFERETEPDAVKRNFDRLRQRFGMEYPILLAGNSSKKTASAAFPMFNSVIAFPTTIILDHTGRNRLLYTGFNGPATGELYRDFKQELTRLIEGLL